MKAGRSAEGARAVSSHTGALAGSDTAFEAAVVQAGAVRAGTLEELFDPPGAPGGPPPAPAPPGAATNGGGLGLLAPDAARRAGLEVAPLAGETRGRLARALPPNAALGN